MRSDKKNRTTISSTAHAPSPEALENILDLTSPHPASNEDSCFKENININKCETPKFAVEPLQMKRKKKGGGCNLRKSLAWDKAFFTEEGVLDPLELSVISGASCKEGLPSINEDTSGGSLPPLKPVDQQKLKNNLINDLQDEDLGRGRMKDWSSPMLDSSASNFMPSTSLTSLKVPTRVVGISGSRCGDCPRPLPILSLKRPASVTVGKATAKELKLPKVPGLKPGLSPVCATTKSTILRASSVKHNQITQPGLKSSSKSFKDTQNASKASSLRLALYSDGNSILQGKSSFERRSSINVIPALVDKGSIAGSKMISDNITQARPVHLSEGQNEPTTFAAPCSQNARVGGRTMHHSQNQTIKPSGLRMPSPSLSFFSQPKLSVLSGLSPRDTEIDVWGSQKPGSLRLQENLRSPKTDNKIPESTITSSKAVSSRSECMASSHVSAVDLIKSNLKQNSMQKVGMKVLYDAFNSDSVGNKHFEDNNYVSDGKIPNISKTNITGRISHEEAELTKIGVEAPLQSGNCVQVPDDNFLKHAIDNYSVKSESCGSGWRKPELRSEQKYATHKSEEISAIDKPHREKNTHSLLVLNHGGIIGTHSEDIVEERAQNSLTMQSDCEETCKPDCHEPHREQTEPFKCSPSETEERTDEDKNVLKTKESTNKQLSLSQQNGSSSSGNASVEALEYRQDKAENSHFGSKHLHVDILKEATSTKVLPCNLLVGNALMQNAICASTIEGNKNLFNLISEVGDDTKQSGKGSEAQNTCLKVEIESHRNVRLNASDMLLPENQICLKKSEQEKDDEQLLLEVPERKDGKKVIDTKSGSPLSPGKIYGCNLDKYKMMEPLISTEFSSVANFLSSESHNKLINATSNCDGEQKGTANIDTSLSETMSVVAVVGRSQDDGDMGNNESENVFLNGPAHGNLSNSLHQDTQGTEIGYCSSFPESRTHEISPKNILGKVTEVGPIVQNDSANNWSTSSMSKDSESDVDNIKLARDSQIVLVKSPGSNMLNECCFKQSEDLALPNAEFVAENIVHGNEGVHFNTYWQTKRPADESYEDSALESMEDSVTGQNKILSGSLRNLNVSAHESPLKHEICNDANGTVGQSPIADAITDSSRIKPFSDTTKCEVSEDTNGSLSCVHPELDHAKVESEPAPNNKHGDTFNEKSRSFVLPQNAIPFSDEWLAAIEAAGEDILTRKGGAVQNSPPDKSLPEPSSWSPVKRKNNQIGPFDCTKFTNTLSSDS